MHKHNTDGFVSIIVASIIMIITTLVTIGFTQLMQREQRQAVDRQLSRQALYAAESGINDIYRQLQADPTLPNQKRECTPNATDPADGSNPISISPVIDATNGIEYTCILYSKQPQRLDKDVSRSESWITQLKSASGDDFTSITISWRNADDTNNSASNLANTAAEQACNGDFPVSRNNSIPVLKVDLTNTSSYNRSSLITGTEYLYLVPCNNPAPAVSTSTHSFDSASRGDVVIVNCNGVTGTSLCSLTIDNLAGLATDEFLSRIRPLYTNAQVAITGTTASGAVEFEGQFSIDVTARAADVVRRLRAAVPLESVEMPPEGVLQSINSACKLLDVNLTNGTVDENPC